jgi:hypothetical protein
MMRRASLIALALAAVTGNHVFAQTQVMPPLAEVARQAEAAKATAKKAKKSYTNSSLSHDPRAEPAAAPPAGVAPSAAKPAAAAEKAAPGETKADAQAPPKESEQTWRMRAASLRKQIEELQARIAQLALPDPLREDNPVLKRTNDVNLANARMALDGLKKQWERLQSSAAEVKVPMAWLDPQPSFQ